MRFLVLAIFAFALLLPIMAIPQPAPGDSASPRKVDHDEVFARALENVRANPNKRYPSSTSYPYCDANRRMSLFARLEGVTAGINAVVGPSFHTYPPSDHACAFLCSGEPTCNVAIFSPGQNDCFLYQDVDYFDYFDGYSSFIRNVDCATAIDTYGVYGTQCCNKYLS